MPTKAWSYHSIRTTAYWHIWAKSGYYISDVLQDNDLYCESSQLCVLLKSGLEGIRTWWKTGRKDGVVADRMKVWKLFLIITERNDNVCSRIFYKIIFSFEIYYAIIALFTVTKEVRRRNCPTAVNLTIFIMFYLKYYTVIPLFIAKNNVKFHGLGSSGHRLYMITVFPVDIRSLLMF